MTSHFGSSVAVTHPLQTLDAAAWRLGTTSHPELQALGATRRRTECEIRVPTAHAGAEKSGSNDVRSRSTPTSPEALHS